MLKFIPIMLLSIAQKSSIMLNDMLEQTALLEFIHIQARITVLLELMFHTISVLLE